MIFANYIITGLLVSDQKTEVNGIDIHISDVFWAGSAALVLLAFDLGFRKAQRRTVLRNLLAWVVTAIVAMSLDMLAIYGISHQPLPTDFVIQLLTGCVALVANCFFFTLCVAGLIDGRSITRNLRTSQSQLIELRTSTVSELNAYAEKLQSPIVSGIAKLRAEIDPLLTPGAQARPVSLSLGRFLQTELRPTLESMTMTKDRVARPLKIKARRVTAVALSQVPLNQSLNVWTALAAMSCYFVVSAYFIDGILGMLSVAVPAVLVTAFLQFLQRKYGARRFHWIAMSTSHSIVYFTFLFVGGAVFQRSNMPTFMIAVVMALIVWAMSSLQCLLARRSALIKELTEVNKSLESSITELEQRMTFLRTRLVSHAHNTMQAQLVNLSIQLASRDRLNAESIDQVSSVLGELATMAKSEPAKAQPFSKTFSDIIKFWSGALDINADVTTSASDYLEKNSVLASRALAVLKEALTNAAKYSSLDGVDISIATDEYDQIEILISNHFDERIQHLDEGLGTAILNSNASSWLRETDNGIYRVKATFA